MKRYILPLFCALFVFFGFTNVKAAALPGTDEKPDGWPEDVPLINSGWADKVYPEGAMFLYIDPDGYYWFETCNNEDGYFGYYSNNGRVLHQNGAKNCTDFKTHPNWFNSTGWTEQVYSTTNYVQTILWSNKDIIDMETGAVVFQAPLTEKAFHLSVAEMATEPAETIQTTMKTLMAFSVGLLALVIILPICLKVLRRFLGR